jgi:chloramphenicol O-acetyltransferase
MRYQPVDPYPRRPLFELFRAHRDPFYSVTVELPAGKVLARARELGVSGYLALCWHVARGLLTVEDFRHRFVDGRVVRFESLDLSLTVPAPGGCFSFAHLAWDDDFQTFAARAAPTLAAASAAVTLPEVPHEGYVYFTSLPGVPFTEFSHARPNDPLEGRTQIGFGRYRREADEVWVPTGLLVNHVWVDGRALGELHAAVVTSLASPG